MLAKKFEVAIYKPWCKGCNVCVSVCPKKVLALNERMKCEPVHQESCIGCKSCENICPDLAITVKEIREEVAVNG